MPSTTEIIAEVEDSYRKIADTLRLQNTNDALSAALFKTVELANSETLPRRPDSTQEDSLAKLIRNNLIRLSGTTNGPYAYVLNPPTLLINGVNTSQIEDYYGKKIIAVDLRIRSQGPGLAREEITSARRGANGEIQYFKREVKKPEHTLEAVLAAIIKPDLRSVSRQTTNKEDFSIFTFFDAHLS